MKFISREPVPCREDSASFAEALVQQCLLLFKLLEFRIPGSGELMQKAEHQRRQRRARLLRLGLSRVKSGIVQIKGDLFHGHSLPQIQKNRHTMAP
jgi:hypothetical protein